MEIEKKELPSIVRENVEKWLSGPYDAKTKDRIHYLLQNDRKELINAFYKPLKF